MSLSDTCDCKSPEEHSVRLREFRSKINLTTTPIFFEVCWDLGFVPMSDYAIPGWRTVVSRPMILSGITVN